MLTILNNSITMGCAGFKTYLQASRVPRPGSALEIHVSCTKLHSVTLLLCQRGTRTDLQLTHNSMPVSICSLGVLVAIVCNIASIFKRA